MDDDVRLRDQQHARSSDRLVRAIRRRHAALREVIDETARRERRLWWRLRTRKPLAH
jgi:hypothetical protein